jgi:hypothetical protein
MKWGLGALGLAAAGVVAIAAIGAGGGAFAQTPPAEDQGRGERYRELLAAELGITVEELTTAQTAARDKLIDEKLAAGEITAEQAERLKSLEPGEGLGFAIGRHMLGHKLHRAVVSVFEAAADVVGLPLEDLRERLAGGESLADIAASQDIDEATLTTDLVAALTAKINQAVADGGLDEERAARLLENLDGLVDRAIDAELPFGELQSGGPTGQRFFDRFFR